MSLEIEWHSKLISYGKRIPFEKKCPFKNICLEILLPLTAANLVNGTIELKSRNLI